MNSRSPWAAVLLVVLCWVKDATVSAQAPPTPQSPSAAVAPAQEIIPPVPTHWFSDYAKATGPIFAIELDRRLESLKRETTNQFSVVIFPKMQSSAEMSAYCLRVFNAWHVGQKGVDNGVILFVFLEDHKLRIEIGRGLELVLTHPVCQGIVDSITNRFRAGDYEGCITVGVDAIVQTIKTQGPPQRTSR